MQDSDKWSAFACISNEEHTEVAELLLDHDTQVNTQDVDTMLQQPPDYLLLKHITSLTQTHHTSR